MIRPIVACPFLTLLVFLAAALPVLADPLERPETTSISEELVYQTIAPDTYVVSDVAYHDSNVLVAKMEDGTVLIGSSPFETVAADAMVRWIQQKLAPKRMIAINTHFHADGTGGNEAYQNHGVETWAGTMTRQLHIEKGETYRALEQRGMERQDLRARIQARKLVPATNTFETTAGKVFTFGSEQVKVIYPGPAHSSDNMVVYLPMRKVLFGGCMIKPGPSLGNLSDADIPRWAASAESLKKLGAEIVIPGHGLKIGGPEYLDRTIALAKRSGKNIN